MVDDIVSRRDFLSRATAAGLAVGALGVWPRTAHGATSGVPEEPTIAVFSKHLQWMSHPDVALTVKESGFSAVDLTVRPGGHVEPERVEDDLPRAVAFLASSGITVPMITTAITDANDPLTRKVLTAARKVGITHYRMGYWSYPMNVDPLRALRDLRARARELAALDKELDIHGGYQNHVGTRVGGSVWDLGVLLEEIDPRWLGVQYDIRHAVAEGGESWPVALRLIAPHIDTLAIKDFAWTRRADGKWEPRSVPLGEGMVDYPAFLRQLLATRPLPPMTMHFEYPPLEMAGPGDATRRQQTADGMRRDLTRFKQLLAAAMAAPATSAPTGS